jgi:hypothetical protein
VPEKTVNGSDETSPACARGFSLREQHGERPTVGISFAGAAACPVRSRQKRPDLLQCPLREFVEGIRNERPFPTDRLGNLETLD